MLFASILVIGTAVCGVAWLKMRHQRKDAQKSR
jgi:hypothetical protein